MTDRARIIRNFSGIARKISRLAGVLALGSLPMLAQAAGSVNVQGEIKYGGKTYTILPILLPPEEQRELAISPSSDLKAYAQPSLMPDDKVLLNVQIYETRKGRMAQLTAATLVIHSGREHTENIDTAYGKLTVTTKVEISTQSAPAATKNTTNYAPVSPPKVMGTMPDEQRAVPRPIGK